MSIVPSHFPRLCLRVTVLLATAILILVAFPFNRSLVLSLLVDGRYPPLYPHYHKLELELPHYRVYEHSDVKYLWSPNHPISMPRPVLHSTLLIINIEVGWGNIMQDYILSYVLAYASNRSSVASQAETPRP